jgi:hypothetical protein
MKGRFPMPQALKLDAVLGPGGKIEIPSSRLPEGSRVVVFVVEDESPKLPIYEILGDYKGGELFKTTEEVDAYIREERDSWDK